MSAVLGRAVSAPPMRIVFLTGIWPPDVGGPATHGPEFSRLLTGRGHRVVVDTMGDGEPAVRPCEVVVVSRAAPFPVRYARVAGTAAREGAAGGCDLRHRHLCGRRRRVGDRPSAARRQARVRPRLRAGPALRALPGSLEEFQLPAGRRVEALKQARTRALRRARVIVVPSAYLARIGPAGGSATSRSSCSTTLRRGSRLMRCGHQARLPSSGGSRARRTSISRSPLSPGSRRHGL